MNHALWSEFVERVERLEAEVRSIKRSLQSRKKELVPKTNPITSEPHLQFYRLGKQQMWRWWLGSEPTGRFFKSETAARKWGKTALKAR